MDPVKRQKLYKLLKQWTRAEIMARFAPLGYPEFAEHAYTEYELRDKIRELLYGESSLVALGQRWGIVQEFEAIEKRKTRNAEKNKKEKNVEKGKVYRGTRAHKKTVRSQRETNRANSRNKQRARNGKVRRLW